MSDLIGKLVADKYRVERLFREEESGDLFVGRHEILDKPVTLQILPQALSIDQRWAKRFIDAARQASAVVHPNVLELSDFGSDSRGVTYAVFEPTGEFTLDLELSGEPLSQSSALAIGRQIADAVAAAHEKKVLHCHLEPKRVFLEGDKADPQRVKVYGFGTDRMTVARDADPRHLAPEQLNAFPAADERSDVYSIGLIIYEMLTGVVPFDGKTAGEVLDKINAEPPPPMSAFQRDLHPDLEPIILTAMAVNPEKRYQSVAALAEDLRMVAGAPASVAAAAGEGKKHNVWQTAFIALVGIILLATALIYATYTRRTDPTAQLQADPASLPVQPIGPATGAQEESLAKLPEMTEAEIMAAQNTNTLSLNPADTLPGGDGYNAWASGGTPPSGAPLTQYTPPGGQTVTINPNGGSQFMPPENGTVLYTKDPSGRCLRIPSYEPFPCPPDSAVIKPTPKPEGTPKTPAGNANSSAANTSPASTPKPMATPPPRTSPGANRPANSRPATNKPDETEN